MSGGDSINQISSGASQDSVDGRALKEAQHQIRNYVHISKGIVSILLASDNITAKQRELLVILEENSDLLQEAVDSIFDSTKPEITH